MRNNTGWLVVLMAVLASAAETSAHFKLLTPAPWVTTNDLGDPQKVGPCGGDPKGQNEALLSKVVTKVAGGSRLHVKIQETIFHSGHYRVALAVNSRTELPPDPYTAEKWTQKGLYSVWGQIQSPPQIPVLADGLFFGNLDFNGQPVPGSHDVLLLENILNGVGHGVTQGGEHSDVHTWYHGTIPNAAGYPDSDGDGFSITAEWYAFPNPARSASGFAYSRLAPDGVANRLSYAIAREHGGRGERFAPDRGGGSQWANIGQITIPAYPNNRYPQGRDLTASFKYQDRDSGVRVEWFLDTDTNPLNNGNASPIYTQTFLSTGDKVANASVTISTAGLNVGITRRLLAKIISLNNNAVRYDYADNTFTVTAPDFALETVTPDSVLAGAGTTRLTLRGSAFRAGDKVLFFNGTTTTPVTPVSVAAGQIIVDFNFGSTLRTWDVSVQQYVDSLPDRASESLPVEVRSSTPTGPAITMQSADATVVFGQMATFTVAATGMGALTYQWQRNGLAIAGATTASYTTSPVSYAHDGYTYRVLVTDDNGTTPSRLATLNVVPPTVACNDPGEPNDHSYQATVLPLGVTTNGLICSAVDADWFLVTMTTNGQLNLALTVPDGLDYDLELYGPDYAWVTGSYEQAGENESIQRTVVAGDYYVRVYGYRGAYSPSQFYQLSANAAELQPPGPTSGPITNAVIWSGIVEPTGDVTILSGGSLKIMPGTQVRCAGGDDRASGADSSRVEIILNGGTLDARGAPDALIRFTSRAQNPIPGNWYGVRILEGDVTVRNCVVEYAVEGIRFEDTDTRFNSYALADSTVQRCSGNGVFVTSGSYLLPVVLDNFQLLANGTGLSAQGPAEFRGGRAEGNNGYGLYSYNSSLVVAGAVLRLNGQAGVYGFVSSLNVAGCTLSYNRGAGIQGVHSSLQMQGCTVVRNDGWGVDCYYANGGTRPAEVWNNLIQSNASGGLTLNYRLIVGVVSNTITDNGATGLQLYFDGSGGVSASGITGNVIRRQDVGVRVIGYGPPLLTLSGNDLFQNTSFELRNESGISITANNCYWGEPTTTEWTAGQVNLSRIYDVRDNASYGQVLILIIRGTPALQAPRFSTQPQSVSALPGESVELSTSASGSDPITYQWYRNGSPVTQATAPDLVLANLNASKAGSYFIVAANAAGRATSVVAQVTLIQPPAPPVIVQHPVSQTVALGGSVSFAVAATGTGPFNYQWRKNSAPIPGASAATFSIASVLVSDAAEYTVTVSNPGGNSTSQPATLTVNTLGSTIVTRQITQMGTNFFVTVTIIPPVGTPVYLVEEFIPAGFTVRDISSSGSLDAPNGRVVWGPFWDGLTRTLAYTLVPPAGFTGTTTLNGAALFFGATAATAGDNLLALRPTGQPARLSLTRVSGIFAISVAGEVVLGV